jgi:hypoxia up-regulated 1
VVIKLLFYVPQVLKFETLFQIENLLENIDVKIEVKREKLLELNSDFFERVTKPIETALMTSSITMDEISEVILMGAGTRVPRVQVPDNVSCICFK